jgi:hypothetical protein
VRKTATAGTLARDRNDAGAACQTDRVPVVNVTAGNTSGLPVGISFIGTAWSEPTLIRLASGFEAVTQARQKPGFRQSLPIDGPFPAFARRAGARRRDGVPARPTGRPVFAGRL